MRQVDKRPAVGYPDRGLVQHGIGKNLLDEIFVFAKNNHCKKVRWQVSNWNQNAIAFYKKTGATIDDVEINCELKL